MLFSRSRQFHLPLFLILSLAASASAASGPATDVALEKALYDNPNGNTHVVCLHDYTQSYELYIPSSVPTTGPASILYGFDPGGNGKGTLLTLAAAAAENGWILAVSNNSKNGPWTTIFTAQDAIIRDTEARLNLHPTRRFASGISGGARASLALAFRYPDKICGVLGAAAGWPVNTTLQPSTKRLIVRLTIGTSDSNYISDVPSTQGRLVDYGIRCVVDTFGGGHEWPPSTMLLDAARWLNQNAEKDPNAGIVAATCPEESLFGQPPNMPTGPWKSYYGDGFWNPTMVDDFHGVTKPITRVDWWGITAKNDAMTGYWLPCEPDTNDFFVTFYTDNNGAPGTKMHTEHVTASRVELPGMYSNNYSLQRYSVLLSRPVSLASGWIEIEYWPESESESEAEFLWLNSSTGNRQSYSHLFAGNEYTSVSDDMAFNLAVEKLSCSYVTSSTWGTPPYTVEFHGTVTGDMGEDVTWHWDFGDGTVADGDPNPTHEYLNNGVYTPILTVTSPTRTGTFRRNELVVIAESLPMSTSVAAGVAVLVACIGARVLRRIRS